MSSPSIGANESYSPSLSFPRKATKAVNRMLQDTDGAGTFFRFICSVGEGCEMAFGKQMGFTYLKNHVACANVLDATPVRTFNAFLGKSDSKESLLARAKGYSFGIVNIACVPLLLQDIQAINLSQIAASIGNKVKAFQFLGRLSLITIVKSLLIFGNLFGAMDAVKRIMDKDNFEKKTTFEKRATYLELAAHVASIALYTLGLIVGVSQLPLVILGVVAYGLGVSRVLHKFANEENKQWEKQQQQQAKV